MNVWGKFALGAVALAGGSSVAAYRAQRIAMAHAEAAYGRIFASATPPPRRFDPAQVTHLPDIAQRYFRHAIAPGTPLYSVVELEMEGTFLLGSGDNVQTYRLAARQALSARPEFVWLPKLRSGALAISGSDGLVENEAWTRFWLMGLVPIVQERSSPDTLRSAQFRAAVESGLWLPASLLPENGVEWREVGPNEAEITFRRVQPAIVIRMTLAPDGAVQEVVGQRWSNANPEKAFKLQPFGGAIAREGQFQGFTVPTGLAVGNHYGTDDFLPFFQTRITKAKYN